MDNLQINTGEKRIAINGDPERVLVFNPSDVAFAERFYRLVDDLQKKLTEYQPRSEAMEAVTKVDEYGVPVNMQDRIAFANEVCDYMRGQIDTLFGKGTSQIVFGDTRELDMFDQFLNGLTPFIQKARSDKVKKYTNKRPKRVMK